MKMRDALEELKTLANERYCSLSYEIITRADGKEIIQCSAYIDSDEGGKIVRAENFKRVLSELRGEEEEEEQDIEL